MSVPIHVCGGCGLRLVRWQVIAGENFTDLVARHLVEDANDPELCGPVTPLEGAAADAVAPPGTALQLATDEEHALIERLSVALGHRLLLEWDAVPTEARALSMNRACLSALARTLGQFLAAIATVQPDNEAGWRQLVELALTIARQTAIEKRLEAIRPDAEAGALSHDDPTKPVYVFPTPETVM